MQKSVSPTSHAVAKHEVIPDALHHLTLSAVFLVFLTIGLVTRTIYYDERHLTPGLVINSIIHSS